MKGFLAALVLVLSSFAAFAEPTALPPPVLAQSSAADEPFGSPYHVGAVREAELSAQVPLRDYLSSRIDQLRSEFMAVIDERDKRYAQRFDAQQEALTAALQAAKEAVAQALSAAKEAVTKAENATEDRFKSVNEFRQTLTDQAATFPQKTEVNFRFTALEDAVRVVTARLDATKNAGEGASSVWVFIGGLIGVAGVIFGVVMAWPKPARPA